MARRKRRHLRTWVKQALIILLCAIIAFVIIRTGYHIHKTDPEPSPTPSPTPSSTAVITAAPSETASADPNELASEFTDADSLLIIANKKHRLPEGYVPPNLRDVNVSTNGNSVQLQDEAASALEQMFTAAQNEGIYLICASGYRSEEYQAELYNMYASRDGTDAADEYSSRPGYSDHQTGLAADISDHDEATFLTTDMINTPEGQWLYQHAHEYGFILRYPEGKEAITGYEFEPWHYRYVGVENASLIYNTSPDETMEEFYGITGGNYDN